MAANIVEFSKVLDSINRLLKNKILISKFVGQLPGVQETILMVEDELWKALEQYPQPPLSLVKNKAIDLYAESQAEDELAHWGYQETRDLRIENARQQDVKNMLMLDTEYDLDTHEIRFFSWLNLEDPGEKLVFLTLALDMESLGDPKDPNGDYKVDAVRAVRLASGHFPSRQELLNLAIGSLAYPFVTRWKMGSRKFMMKHPICPRCGCLVLPEQDEKEDWYYACSNDDCGWKMKHHEEYKLDLTERYVEPEIFDKELKAVKRAVEKERSINAARLEIEMNLKILDKTCTKEERAELKKTLQKMLDQYFPEK